jgi:hypothetical protein
MVTVNRRAARRQLRLTTADAGARRIAGALVRGGKVDAPECPLAELFPDAPQAVKVTTKMATQAGFCKRRVEVTTRLAIHD